MTAKHIPGPWSAHAPSEDLDKRHWTIRAPGSGSVVSFEVARVSGRSATDQHTARLIAAAPDLLQCLRWMVGLYEQRFLEEGKLAAGAEYCASLNAIARAEELS